MSDPSVTYRDATYSAETQTHLRSLLTFLEDCTPAGEPWRERKNALADVISRWDDNDATECIFEDDDAA